MDSDGPRLGFLVEGPTGAGSAADGEDAGDDGSAPNVGSGEEAAALAFARAVVADTETVTLDAVAAGTVGLDRFDALWWHAYTPVSDPATVAACAEPLRAFVDGGGGLFCSARALAQVSALDIDPVPPDATGTEAVTDPVGPLWHTLYAGHPAVDGLDGLRHHIRPAGSTAPYARYEDVLPERADVLASTYRGDDEVPTEVTVLQWRLGSGTVIGVGVGMEFAQHDDATTEATRERFAANVIRWLAGTSEYDTALATGRPKTGPELARYRDALSGGRDRPSYHVSPPVNWLNDPNGVIHYDGTYHLFYQYNPAGPYHHTIHWGHAVSDDLVHWADRPVAMTPDPGGPDRDGCWSGCAVAVGVGDGGGDDDVGDGGADDDVGDGGADTDRTEGGDADSPPVAPAGDRANAAVDADGADGVYALYTGGRDGWQRPCLARATDADLTRFEPAADTPVIRSPPAALDLLSTPGEPAHFRDHCLRYEDGRWWQLIGTGLQDRGGAVVSYTSPDLREWTYEGPALVTEATEVGVVWECPELLRFPDADLLHVSDYEDVRYFVGEFDADAGRFRVDDSGTLDPGAFYAPQSCSTPDGRRVAIGWLREERSVARQWDAGWSGAMSLPRELSVVDGELSQRPAREVERLRETRLFDGTVSLDPDRGVGPDRGDGSDPDRERLDVTGEALELRADVDPDAAATVAIRVRETPDGAERTAVQVGHDRVVVDRSESSLEPGVRDAPVSVPVDDLERPLDVRVFVDASVLELFVNGRRALATRIYPTRHDATGVSVAAIPRAGADGERIDDGSNGSDGSKGSDGSETRETPSGTDVDADGRVVVPGGSFAETRTASDDVTVNLTVWRMGTAWSTGGRRTVDPDHRGDRP